jgi:predicted nucleic acid-binding protein
VEPVALPEALGQIAEAVRRLVLTAHDAAYLQLAAVRGLPLATVDERLRGAATVAGVALAG